MHKTKYASIDSQLGTAPCLCEDTEEMFWLQESDDYASRVKLGNLLSEQYRFREAIDAYHTAEMIRADDPMLYIRLGGAYLTLLRFDEAKKAYEKSRSLSGSEQSVAYPMGVWHYLQRDYQSAATALQSSALRRRNVNRCPVLARPVLYAQKLPDTLISTYRDDRPGTIQHQSAGGHPRKSTAIQPFGKRNRRK